MDLKKMYYFLDRLFLRLIVFLDLEHLIAIIHESKIDEVNKAG